MRQDKAFPQTISLDGISSTTDGLTKREFFAAFILSGRMAHGATSLDTVAEAVEYADALIEKLGEKNV
jgi:hypothetical protein